jgi:hypothetical protein
MGWSQISASSTDVAQQAFVTMPARKPSGSQPEPFQQQWIVQEGLSALEVHGLDRPHALELREHLAQLLAGESALRLVHE